MKYTSIYFKGFFYYPKLTVWSVSQPGIWIICLSTWPCLRAKEKYLQFTWLVRLAVIKYEKFNATSRFKLHIVTSCLDEIHYGSLIQAALVPVMFHFVLNFWVPRVWFDVLLVLLIQCFNSFETCTCSFVFTINFTLYHNKFHSSLHISKTDTPRENPG